MRLVESELVDTESCYAYLDHAGAAIAPKSLLLECSQDLLASQMMGNPHSRSAYEIKMLAARAACLAHFQASSDVYDCIFTSGATHALKLVGEAFDYGHGGALLYPQNVHTSVLGMRAYADRAMVFPAVTLDALARAKRCGKSGSRNAGDESGGTDSDAEGCGGCHLLVVPGECNFSGCKANLTAVGAWVARLSRDRPSIEDLRAACTPIKGDLEIASGCLPVRWLLDAAKLAGSSPVSLAALPPAAQPHFVVASFYKIFGYPTGLGVLLVRRDAAGALRRRYFGGGTVLAAASDRDLVRHRLEPHERWEDGTPHYQGIAAVPRGFACLERLGGLAVVQRHAAGLTRGLALQMAALRHSSGRPLCTLYGRHLEDPDAGLEAYMARQGPVIAFSLHWQDGAPVGFDTVSALAASEGLVLRAGCFCNQGACQAALGLSAADIEANLVLGRSCAGEGGAVLNGRATGCVRVSLGWSSRARDGHRLLAFLGQHFLNRQPRAPGSAWPETPACLSAAPNEVEGGWAEGAEKTCPRLAELYIYPIKSCGGVRVTKWPLGPTGLLLDREWAVVDSGGRALTQKQCPLLALVNVAVDLPAGNLVVRSRGRALGPLRLALGSAGGMAEALSLASADQSSCPSFDPGEACADEGGDEVSEGDASLALFQAVKVCGQYRSARRQGHSEAAANDWFSAFLGTRCFLMRRAARPASGRGLGAGSEAGPEAVANGAFYNEAQLLLVNAASLRAHWAHMQAAPTAPVRQGELGHEGSAKGAGAATANFRPNLVLAGCVAHEEDRWRAVALAGPGGGAALTLAVAGPCQRCSVINVNGATGEVDSRALASLAGYRRKLGAAGTMNFGVYLQQPAGGEGEYFYVCEGAEMTIL